MPTRAWADRNRGDRFDIELQELLPEVAHEHIQRLWVAVGLDQLDPDICIHVVHPRAVTVPAPTRPRPRAPVNALALAGLVAGAAAAV